jgi:hypothetical protein
LQELTETFKKIIALLLAWNLRGMHSSYDSLSGARISLQKLKHFEVR